jgi:hypothetical protein
LSSWKTSTEPTISNYSGFYFEQSLAFPPPLSKLNFLALTCLCSFKSKFNINKGILWKKLFNTAPQYEVNKRSLETRINLLYSIYPDRKHCFGTEKKWIYRFKMVYFWLRRYCKNLLISLSEFPVIYGYQLMETRTSNSKVIRSEWFNWPRIFCPKQCWRTIDDGSGKGANISVNKMLWAKKWDMEKKQKYGDSTPRVE